MVEQGWFTITIPDEECPGGLATDEGAFVTALRERTATWATAGVTGLGRPGDQGSVWLSIGGPGPLDPGVVVGVRFRGGRVRGDLLTDRPSSWALDARGSVEQLARRAAEWLLAVRAKPVVQYEWLNETGRPYAARYLFADTGEAIEQSYDRDLAPPGQAEALIAAGHVQGRGWIRTVALPGPTHYRHVRGDSGRALLPPGVPAAEGIGRMGGLWYDDAEDEERVRTSFTLVCDDVDRDVVLLDCGPRPLEVAKVLRAITGVGLWCAKQVVTGVPPVVLCAGVEETRAGQLADRFRAAGATVVVEAKAWTSRGDDS